jgi:hypothetical protein
MLIFGFDEDSGLCCTFFMPIEQFEHISTKDLFEFTKVDPMRLYFMPAEVMPENDTDAAATIVEFYLTHTKQETQNIILYLHNNGWGVDKDTVP